MIDTAGGSTSAPDGEAAIPVSPSPHIVHLACRCPGSPHRYDIVTLREHATNRMGIAVSAAMTHHRGDAIAIETELAMAWLRYGIVGWNFLDKTEDGETVPVWLSEPVDVALIEQWLPWGNGGKDVLEAADALYKTEVFDPFRPRPTPRSPDGAEAKSISASTDSGPTPPTPLRPSSRKRSAGKRSTR